MLADCPEYEPKSAISSMVTICVTKDELVAKIEKEKLVNPEAVKNIPISEAISNVRKIYDDYIQRKESKVDYANSFNEFYEYDVVSVINQEHGLVDKEMIRQTLMEHARQGWKLHTMYSNELGKNAIRVLGFGVNSTACEDVMIFERRIQSLEMLDQ